MKIPTIKFVFDRKHQASDTAKGSVDLRITYNRAQKFINTGVKCNTSQWDSETESVINALESAELNETLLRIKMQTLRIINNMVEEQAIGLNRIPVLLKSKSINLTFIQYIHNRMTAKNVTENTKKAYHVFYSRFVEWGGITLFTDINEVGVRAWDEYLHKFKWKEKDQHNRTVMKQYSQATIGAMHKNLKLFINDAIIDGYIKENPYTTKKIKINKGQTRINSFLTEQEVTNIENAKLATRSLSEARDLFLLQVYTGLAYIDLMEFNFEICKGANDYAIFSDYRHKTGTMFSFVLTPKAKMILQKYNFNVPQITNQKYNSKLKIIADAAGIDKPICSHDGRRSCGYILLNAGVPMSVVSRILGHSSIKTTESAYARLLDKTIQEEIEKHIKE